MSGCLEKHLRGGDIWAEIPGVRRSQSHGQHSRKRKRIPQWPWDKEGLGVFKEQK